MINEEQRRNNLKKLQEFTLMDDDFMNACFSGYPELTEFVLRIIMKRDDLHVVRAETQRTFTNLLGRSVRFDIDATDDKGVEYDIEIQKTNVGASPKRARDHSSVKDSDLLKKEQPFDALPESCVIFITEHDVLGLELPIYFIERQIVNANQPFNDGEHIIYVNCAHKDVATELGKLVHDLSCSNPDEMFFNEIADVVRYYKETEEGREKMSQIMEDLINEAVAEAIERKDIEYAQKLERKDIEYAQKLERKDIEYAQKLERKDIEYAQKLIQFGALSLEDIANLTNLPLEKIREIAGQENA